MLILVPGELAAVAMPAAWEDVDLAPPNHPDSVVEVATMQLAVQMEYLPAAFVSLDPSVDPEVTKALRRVQFHRQNRK